MRKKLSNKIKEIPGYTWIFLAVLLLGIFLRTYHFHDWLFFEVDQARDATTVNQIVLGEKSWPLLGPTMRGSGDTDEALFHIGPAHYYFQIISTGIFGMSADAKAYPDLLLGILSIPLFYYFLRRYFGEALSLYLVGLYAISFFAIKYARFAWNPNSIPFFVILSLLSWHEFLLKKEKTAWKWVGIAGISLGVGVQLHAETLLIFSLLAIFVTAYLLKQTRLVWKKIACVFLLALLLNTPQLVSEWRTGFSNSRALLSSPIKEGRSDKKSKMFILAENLGCNLEANAYMLSSLGGEACNNKYTKIFKNNNAGKVFRKNVSWLGLFAVFCFSFLGYFLLIYRFRKETRDDRKYYLGLIILFCVIFFVIMLPIIGSDFKEFRYFNPVFFVPFMLVGFIVEFLIQKRNIFCLILALASIFFSIGANILAINMLATRLSEHKGNDGHAVFLGETENMLNYMETLSAGSPGTIYIKDEKLYVENIIYPGTFIAKQGGWNLIRVPSYEYAPKGAPLFFITKNTEDDFSSELSGVTVKNAKNFGLIRIYQLDN